MLFRPASLGLVVLVLSQLAACGRPNYDTTKVKDYRLALTTNDAEFREEFRLLVNDFNSWAGIHVLTFAESVGAANSSIAVEEGLKARTKTNVGEGQWLSETTSESQFFSAGRPDREIVYTMSLRFDADYIRTNMGHKDQKKTYENQKLFFHEVGHGLQMDHDPSSSRSVMWETVDGEKDFEPFFAKVRNYMADD